jgi:hypothetical protein
MSWPDWSRTSVVPAFKAPLPLPTEQPAIGASSRARTGNLPHTRRLRCRLRQGGRVRPPGLRVFCSRQLS